MLQPAMLVATVAAEEKFGGIDALCMAQFLWVKL